MILLRMFPERLIAPNNRDRLQSGDAVEHFGLENREIIQMGTLRKAIGGRRILAGSRVLIDFLVNWERGFIFTTELPPHWLARRLRLTCCVDCRGDEFD